MEYREAMRSTTNRRLRSIAVLSLAAFALGACSAATGVRNALPWGERETILPGERQAITFSTADDGGTEALLGSVNIPAAVANSDWPQPGGFATNATGNLAYSGGLNRAWRTSVGSVGRKGRPPSAPPIVYQGVIYTVNADADVSAINAGSGGRVWSASLKPEGEGRHGATGGGVAASDGRLYVATGFGTVAALNPGNGQVLWQKDLPAPPRSAPTSANGKLYVVSTDGAIYAMNGADGTELWSYNGIPETAGFLSSGSPAVSGSRVIVPFTSGEVLAFNTETGEPIWLDALVRSGRFSAVSGINDVSGRPVVDNGSVFAISVSGRMVSVNESNGERIWTRNLGSSHTPIVAGQTVFIVTLENEAVAIDRATGQTRWVTKLPEDKRRTTYGGPIMAGNRLIIGNNRGDVVALSAADGRVIEQRAVGDPILQSPIVAAGRMYVLSNSGNVIAFN